MNKLEKIVEDGVVKVRVIGAQGKPSHPLMSSNGQFFINAGAAAKAFCCSVPTINNKVKSAQPVKGQILRPATEQEVDSFVAAGLSSVTQSNKPAFMPGKLWEGKLHDDGSVTLARRLGSMVEVPKEMLNDIHWNS
jgi:hypothetical protein